MFRRGQFVPGKIVINGSKKRVKRCKQVIKMIATLQTNIEKEGQKKGIKMLLCMVRLRETKTITSMVFIKKCFLHFCQKNSSSFFYKMKLMK